MASDFGPQNSKEAVDALVDRFSFLADRVARMGSAVENLSQRLGDLGHLAGRVTAAMALLVGAPRVARGGLAYGLLAGSGGGSFGRIGGSGPIDSGPSSSQVARALSRALMGGPSPVDMALLKPFPRMERLRAAMNFLRGNNNLAPLGHHIKNVGVAPDEELARLGIPTDFAAAYTSPAEGHTVNFTPRGARAGLRGLIGHLAHEGTHLYQYARGDKRSKPERELDAYRNQLLARYLHKHQKHQGRFPFHKVFERAERHLRDFIARNYGPFPEGSAVNAPDPTDPMAGVSERTPAKQKLLDDIKRAEHAHEVLKHAAAGMGTGGASPPPPPPPAPPASPGGSNDPRRKALELASTFDKLKGAGEKLRQWFVRRPVENMGDALGGFPVGASPLDRLKGFGRSAPMAALVGTSIAAGAVRTASPDAFEVVTNAFKMLAAQIGVMLVPAFIDFAGWLVKAAAWFAELSPGMKDFIGSATKWSLVSLGAITVLSKVNSALELFGLKLGVGAGLVAAAAAGIAYGAHLISRHAREQAERNRVASETPTTDASVAADEDLASVLNDPSLDREQKRQRLAALVQGRGRTAAEAAARLRDFRSGVFNIGDRDTGEAGRLAGESIATADAHTRALRAMRLLSRNATGTLDFEGGSGGGGAGRSRAMSMLQALLGSVGSRAQPAFTSIEDVHRQSQIEALKSPVEQYFAQLMNEMLPEIKRLLSLQVEEMGRLAGLNERQVRELQDRVRVN